LFLIAILQLLFVSFPFASVGVDLLGRLLLLLEDRLFTTGERHGLGRTSIVIIVVITPR
jgi:hypothetical protein